MMYKATRVINTGYCYNLGCGGGRVVSYGSELTAGRQEGGGLPWLRPSIGRSQA